MNSSGIDGTRTYLEKRDGDADLLNRCLATREEFFRGLEADPVRSTHPIDPRVFMRNVRRRRPEPGVDREMLFLLATAKLNQAERFGVGLGETYGNNSGEDVPPERVYMELEEHYHTRLLAYVLEMFGLPFQVVVPPLVMRQFVKIAVFLPERFGFAFVGASEMAGCVMFDELRRVGVELFADEPDVAAHREALQRDPHRRSGPRWLLRSALHRRGAGADALALPAYRTAVRTTDVRDQPSHRSRETARSSRSALRYRGAHCRPVQRDIRRRTPLSAIRCGHPSRRLPAGWKPANAPTATSNGGPHLTKTTGNPGPIRFTIRRNCSARMTIAASRLSR